VQVRLAAAEDRPVVNVLKLEYRLVGIADEPVV
jgi:hypothetical protein